MLHRTAAVSTALLLYVAAVPAFADRASDLRALSVALGLPEVTRIMAVEGIEHGGEMADDMFPGRGGSGWRDTVARIYDAGVMNGHIEAALDAGIEDDELEVLLDFFTSPRGERIVGFETTAREALLDEDIEAAAEERYAEMRAENDPRLDLLDRFVEANDLVETNVMGAMNSNYAFYVGLMDSGAFGRSMSEQDILTDVWSQEEEIRSETTTWVYSYLAMAYQPLKDTDLEAYIALSETDAGRALNAALFAGFDDAFVAISKSLGMAAARYMVSEDI